MVNAIYTTILDNHPPLRACPSCSFSLACCCSALCQQSYASMLLLMEEHHSNQRSPEGRLQLLRADSDLLRNRAQRMLIWQHRLHTGEMPAPFPDGSLDQHLRRIEALTAATAIDK